MTLEERIFNYLKSHPESMKPEIIEALNLDKNPTTYALQQLKKHGLIVCDDAGNKTRWHVIEGAEYDAANQSTRTRSSPSATGDKIFSRFKKALDDLINAAVELQPYVVTEDEKKELEELREFRSRTMDAAKLLSKGKR